MMASGPAEMSAKADSFRSTRTSRLGNELPTVTNLHARRNSLGGYDGNSRLVPLGNERTLRDSYYQATTDLLSLLGYNICEIITKTPPVMH